MDQESSGFGCTESIGEPDRAVPGDGVDWVTAETSLDDCDGYVVLAVDPQTGEIDAHGIYAGLGALHAAEAMRTTLDEDDLDDVLVRVVRWHVDRRDPGRAA